MSYLRTSVTTGSKNGDPHILLELLAFLIRKLQALRRRRYRCSYRQLRIAPRTGFRNLSLLKIHSDVSASTHSDRFKMFTTYSKQSNFFIRSPRFSLQLRNLNAEQSSAIKHFHDDIVMHPAPKGLHVQTFQRHPESKRAALKIDKLILKSQAARPKEDARTRG